MRRHVVTTDRFVGQVVLVTGGARGIGDAIIRAFVDEGARAVSIDLGDAEEPIERTRYLSADVADLAAVKAAFADVEATEGRLDILVNNAGIQRVALTEAFDPLVWRQVVDVHLFGAYHCSAEALRVMKPRRSGSIISISSVAGLLALPGRGPYSASKAAISALTRVMAVEVAELGIRVNAVAPGSTRTKLVEQGFNDGSLSEASITSEIPMRRLATTGEIAGVVRFLASDEASYITGQTIVVDGGWTIQGIHERPDWLSAS
jgi:NAD(P)-dependent dehydrogenase (short-subunit alcohol dehydrogenase family)